MKFCTSIHCMDGRVQEPVINYLKSKYDFEYYDFITEPGVDKTLAEQTDAEAIKLIKHKIDISTQKHGSRTIFISGHYDCAGNPVDRETHLQQLEKSAKWLHENYSDVEIVVLYINEDWIAEEV